MIRILPDGEESFQMAVRAIREGRLVGMPTETVYGIAADAFNEKAVAATFEAKGRPAENPLIVHLADVSFLDTVAREVPPSARRLAEKFWPGPLTLVLPKQPSVPSITTGGLDTVAVRVPDHVVPRRLAVASSTALSAPSANPFMDLSPTRAEDIDPVLAEKLDVIIDGGPCKVGVESTVVDATGDVVRVLRPGAITLAMLRRAVGDGEMRVGEGPASGERRSPGMYPRHYAPRTPLRIVTALGPHDAGLVFHPPLNANQIQMPRRAGPYAAALYAALHNLDARRLPELLVERPPTTPTWAAVWDRLRRAAESLPLDEASGGQRRSEGL